VIDGAIVRSEHVLLDARVFFQEEDTMTGANNLLNAALDKLGNAVWGEWVKEPRDVVATFEIRLSNPSSRPATYFNREAVQ
jgi:hypothetical protein